MAELSVVVAGNAIVSVELLKGLVMAFTWALAFSTAFATALRVGDVISYQKNKWWALIIIPFGFFAVEWFV